MEQTLCLRGVNFKVKWELATCEEPHHAEWKGRGPARSHAETEYRLTAVDGGGTRFDYRNEFKAPLGPLGRGGEPGARRRPARARGARDAQEPQGAGGTRIASSRAIASSPVKNTASILPNMSSAMPSGSSSFASAKPSAIA